MAAAEGFCVPAITHPTITVLPVVSELNVTVADVALLVETFLTDPSIHIIGTGSAIVI